MAIFFGESVEEQARAVAIERVLNIVLPGFDSGSISLAASRYKLRERLRDGHLDERLLEVHIQRPPGDAEKRRLAELASALATRFDLPEVELVGLASKLFKRPLITRKRMTVKETLDYLYEKELSRLKVAAEVESVQFDSPAPLSQLVVVQNELMKLVRQDPHHIYQLTHDQFEYFILDLLIRYGFQGEITARTRDGGCDIIAVNTDQLGIKSRYIIEAKHYRPPNKVGVQIVRQLNTVCLRERGHHGVLVTSSYFTRDAVTENARFYSLQLTDFDRLALWIQRAPTGYL